MIFVYKDRIIHVEWTVFKGKTLVHEDFTRALIKVFLVGVGERYLLQARECRGTLYFDVEDGLPEGVYSLELIYVKNMGNLHCCKYNDRCFMRSRVDNAFAITDYQSEATDQYEDDVRLRYKSQVASYGYDGLSAYEIAVLRGDWNGTEGDWLEWVHQGIVDNVSRFINSVYLEWKGSAYKTRNSMPEAMRRKGIIISYRLPNGDIVTEKSATDSKEDIIWGQDGVWERIDNLSLSGDISVSTNGTWVINGHDTGMLAVGPKGNNGLTPLIRTYENKLQYSYDGVEWKNASEDYIAAWFRWEDNKIQISRDQQNWSDLSESFTNSLYIKGYAATTGELPRNPQLGDMYMVGPTYDESDSSHENPLYNLYVYTSSGWKDNGRFNSIQAGVVQTKGSSTTEVMSQKAVTDELETLGTIEDNGEYIRAYTDAEGKFLWGIRVDGTIEWAKGIPTPIQNSLKELENKLNDYTDEGIEELQAAIDVINAALKPLTDTFSYQDNPEFVNVVTDKDGKVLFGIKEDGRPYFPKNELYNVESNQEFLAVWLDAAGHVLFGLKQDGSTYVAKADFLDKIAEIQRLLEENGIGDSQLAEQVAQLQDDMEAMQDTFYHEENAEFAYVVTDAEGKVLFGIKTDGEPYYPNNEMYRVVQNNEYMAAWVDASDKVLFGIKSDGSVYIAKSELIDKVSGIAKAVNEMKPLAETFSIISNDEWLHAIVDAKGKLLFGIKAENGKVVMPKQDTYKVVSNDEWLAAWLDATDKILFGVKADGTFWAAKSNFAGGGNYDEQIAQLNEEIQQLKDQIQATASDVFSVIDDAEERLSVTTDKDERVISYRDKDGVLHENKGIDTSKYYLNGEEKDFTDRSEIAGEVTKAAENGAVKLENVDGVSNHNTPNLLIADEMQKTFNDGTNSFTPPNAGYEMSNPIECKAGDWFTRTGTATGMVVVTDENDKNGTRLFNADGTTLGNTFQIPEDMTWVRYIRMAAEVGGANNGSVVICKGRVAYIGDEKGDFLTVDKLRIQNYNIPKDVKYLRSSDGKYWELYVDESHQLQIREIDPDIIAELPSNFKPWTLTGTFDGKFDRMVLQNPNFFIEIKASGVVKYKNIGSVNTGNFANFEHFYSPTGDDRYGFIFHTSNSNVIGKRFTLFDGEFNILDTNVGLEGYNGTTPDMHDFVYINDEHIILCSATYSSDINVPGNDEIKNITTGAIYELKKIDGIWKVVGTFYPKDYPALCTDAFGNPDNTIASHWNTVGLDYDGNLIVNYRNWETWIKIKRTENSDGTVTLGSKTLDYDEAIIGRVGGRHNSAYLDSKRVLNEGFSFTDTPASLTDMSDDDWEEWQWYHCHDVKYWGMKQIGDKQYPTYTLFDNNYWTGNNFSTSGYNVPNRNNNIDINPQGDGNYYQESKDGNENYAKYQHSRVIQMSIDWENHKVMDYRLYYIPKLYSKEQGGATMYDEGIISIAYSYAGEFGLWDFTTGETEVSGHIYKGAKQLFLGKYDIPTFTYRANTYKLNN